MEVIKKLRKMYASLTEDCNNYNAMLNSGRADSKFYEEQLEKIKEAMDFIEVAFEANNIEI